MYRARLHCLRYLHEGLPDWKGLKHDFIQIGNDEFKIWLAGPTTMVVGLVLVGKVLNFMFENKTCDHPR